jgi:Zn-dependent peptidase ImmA (M78 family)/DNA-binding XRE family transcriptional regulator
MPLSSELLARRLREAREAAGITQQTAADALGLQRTAIIQIEADKRSVSSLEIAKFADLYCKSIASLLDTRDEPAPEDSLVALFRAAGAVKDAAWRTDVARCVEICRAGAELKKSLGGGDPYLPPFHDVPTPQNKADAVEQGCKAAEDERRRLGLGIQPIPDMADLVNAQGIWASGARLPDEIAGVFLKDADAGVVILVNYGQARVRKRFSYAHEYAHVLFDRQATAIVSWENHKHDLRETRANAFAAAFLLPAAGIQSFLTARSKGGTSVTEHAVYRPNDEATPPLLARRRAPPGAHAVTFEDVAALARMYGVSYQAAAYRLMNAQAVSQKEGAALLEKEAHATRYLSMLRLEDDVPRRPDREITREVVHLALEAFRREEISGGKLRDLGKLLDVPVKDLLALAEAA